METDTRSQQPQQIPRGRKVQNGDTINNKDLPPDRGVGSIHRFQGRLLPHTNCKPFLEVLKTSCTRTNIPVQGTTIWSVNSTNGVHCSGQRGQTDGTAEGIRIHQYLDDWLVRARSHQTCLQHTQTLVTIYQDLGWLVNREKSEPDPKQVVDLVGYQFDLKEGKVRPTLDQCPS